VKCRDLCEWFDVERCLAIIQHWCQAYAEYYDQDFIAEPNCVAFDENGSIESTDSVGVSR